MSPKTIRFLTISFACIGAGMTIFGIRQTPLWPMIQENRWLENSVTVVSGFLWGKLAIWLQDKQWTHDEIEN